MGEFDIDYAVGAPQGGAAGVRANLDVSTGTEAITGAIQRLGGDLLDVDIAMQKSQQAMELSTFQRKDEEVKASALQTLLSPDFDINDEDAIVKLKEKTDTDRTGQTSKSGSVNFLYGLHLDKTSPAFDKKFFDEIRGIKAGNAKDDFNLNSESFLAKGDLVNYQQLVNRAFETRVITKTEQKYRTENALIDSVFAQSRAMISDGNYFEATVQLGALEGLTPTQKEYRDKLLKNAQLVAKQQDDEIGEGFLTLLSNKLDPKKDQLTFDMITNSNLSFEGKDAWFTKLRVFDNYSEGELKEAFTDKGEVLADLYDKKDKGTLENKDIDNAVGNGLSPKTGQTIKKEILKPYERDTEQLFKRIFGWTPELGFENDVAGFFYEKVLREWRDEVKRQEATGEKVIEIGRSIARPYFIKHVQATMTTLDASLMADLALGEEVEEFETIEETGETYEEFRARIVELKKTDMEKAKAEYDKGIGQYAR